VTVTLVNRQRRMVVLLLPHDSYCAAAGRCACVTVAGRDGVRVASSLTLAAEAARAGLPEAIVSVPDVVHGWRTGAIALRREPAPGSRSPRPGRRKRGAQ
jgi:hypothetical protein